MTPHPVSDALTETLHAEAHRHGIVVWLDRHAEFTAFVDRLQERQVTDGLPFHVLAWRGSHLDVLRQAAPHTGGTNPPPLLLHLPGFTEDDVKGSPLLELYLAGRRYRIRLETLVAEAAAGRVAPSALQEALAEGLSTLEDADRWLHREVQSASGDLSDFLGGLGLAGVVTELGHPDGRLVQALHDELATFWDHLARRVGLTPEWRQALELGDRPGPHRVREVVVGWCLAVELVHDLTRPTTTLLLGPVAELPGSVVQECVALCAELRKRHADLLRGVALAVEDVVAEEIQAGRPDQLGARDSFRLEADRMLEGALQALDEERWDQALAWARDRLQGGFWLTVEPDRTGAWRLVGRLASLGQTLEAAGPGLGTARNLADAVARYAGDGAGWQVDQAHRKLEQEVLTLRHDLARLPRSAELRACLAAGRDAWREWARTWAEDFAALCQAEGFLPPPELQQRTLFDDRVRPWAEPDHPVAFFLVDALRFELGADLHRAFEGERATTVRLEARLAELPTETSVGMNALAPVSRDGVLEPVVGKRHLEGFRAGDFTVRSPDDRRRAMAERVGGRTCPRISLQELLDREPQSLAQTLRGASMLLVTSLEIDKAGETGHGLQVYERALANLQAAWRKLRDVGVRRFVFTADHGFLLLDDRVQPQAFGRSIDPSRRHVLRRDRLAEPGLQQVALSSLGYAGAEGIWLHLPRDIRTFDTGGTPTDFVHGGNSLQERVIPVLIVEHRAPPGRTTLKYRIRARAGEGLGDLCCLEGVLEQGDAPTLGFGGSTSVLLHLEPVGEGLRADLVQVRRGGERRGDGFLVRPGEPFEVFFHLLGRTLRPGRVRLVHRAGAADVRAQDVEGLFGVRPLLGLQSEPAAPTRPAGPDLTALPAEVRPVFGLLLEGRALNERELQDLLGRAARRFARRVDEYAEVLGIQIRVEITAQGTKRYRREEP